MIGSNAARRIDGAPATMQLFDAVGAFLRAQGLGPDPRNYAFAYAVLKDPAGPLHRRVDALTDGGVRLSRRDIEELGGEIGLGAPADAGPSEAELAAQQLVAQTNRQADSLAGVAGDIHSETIDFGRDIAASADAIRAAADGFGVDEVVRLTGTLLDRIRSAEQRLDAARAETDTLREALSQARDNARRDPLTDLPNRRAFEEAFADRAAGGIVAIVDVDHFKRVNDGFGHPVGDRVLKAVAGELAATCTGHTVARIGGEEFAVLFTGVTLPVAIDVLNNARERVAAKHYKVRGTDAPLGTITFSAGICTVRPGEEMGQAFKRADDLLYAAKEGGRNNVRH